MLSVDDVALVNRALAAEIIQHSREPERSVPKDDQWMAEDWGAGPR